MSRKMMLVTFMVLPFLAARPVLAQDTLKLDLGKAGCKLVCSTACLADGKRVDYLHHRCCAGNICCD